MTPPRPLFNGIGNRASELTMASISPPTGTLIKEHVEGMLGLPHTVTGRWGPAPLTANPRSESGPPEKKRSLSGTKLLANGAASPMRKLLAQVSHGRMGR